MPGPCNAKRRSKQQAKKSRQRALKLQEQLLQSPGDSIREDTRDVVSPVVCHVLVPEQPHVSPTPTPESPTSQQFEAIDDSSQPQYTNTEFLKRPFIEDPGNGPRVKDTNAFLSSFFAPPPSLDDPHCAAFADARVLGTLRLILPEEVALILWYNKTRRTGRICPACQRLYHLGDALPHHVASLPTEDTPPHALREQQLSGICSSMCFIVASFNYPGAISVSWGKTADELDDVTCALLNGPGQGLDDQGLGLLLRLTRLHDLGLGQMGCFRDGDTANGC